MSIIEKYVRSILAKMITSYIIAVPQDATLVIFSVDTEEQATELAQVLAEHPNESQEYVVVTGPVTCYTLKRL